MAIWDFESEGESNLLGGILRAASTGFGDFAQSGFGQGIGAGFSALGTGVHTALDFMGRPGAGVRNMAFGGYADNEYGLDPTGIAARGRNFMAGLGGYGTTGSFADALPDMWAGPVNLRGAAGFGLDVLTDPLNLLPTGPIGGIAKTPFLRRIGAVDDFVPRGAEFGETVPFSNRIAERLGTLQEPLEGAAGLTSKLGPLVRPIDPSLSPKTSWDDFSTAFRGAMEDRANDVQNLTSYFSTHGGADEMAGFLRDTYKSRADDLTDIATEAGRYAKKRMDQIDWHNPQAAITAIRETELATEFAPLAKQMDVQRIEAAKQAADESLKARDLAQEFYNLTQRAKRGEQIVEGMLTPFREQFPELADYFSNINQIARSHRRGAPLAEGVFLNDLAAQAKDELLRANQLRRAQLGELALTTAREAAGVEGRVTLSGHAQPYAKGLWFMPDEAERISELLAQRPPEILRAASSAMGISRASQATLDISAAMIQGLPTLVRDPVTFLNGFAKSVQAWKNPDFLDTYLARPENQEVLARAQGLVTGTGIGTEITEGLPNLIRKPLDPLFSRAEASFNTFGTVVRVEMAKALLPSAEKAGKVRQMVDELNHLTGIVGTGGMGVSPTQQAVESLLLFAPRYTRSALAVVGDAIQNPTGEAAQSIFGMLTAGLANYVHLAEASGQKPELDPSNSKFMSLQIGDARVGIGSVWVSLLRTGAQVLTAPEKNPANTLEALTNPLLNFWRGKSSPLVSYVWDLAEQETYIGTPIDNFKSRAARTVALVTPFGIQGMMIDMGAHGKPSPVQGAASLLGLRASPRRISDITEEVAQSKFGQSFDTLGPVEQAQVRNEPQVKSLPLPAGGKYEGMRERTGFMNEYSSNLEQAAELVASGKMTKTEFRKAEERFSNDRDSKLSTIPEEGRTSQDPREQARQEYLRLFRPDKITGQTDYEKAEGYFATLDPATQQYINEKRLASLEYLGPKAKPLMADLQEAREKLRPYWELQNEALDRFGLLERARNAMGPEREALEREPKYRAAERLWERRRELMRAQRPDIDEELVDWYGYTPIRMSLARRNARS